MQGAKVRNDGMIFYQYSIKKLLHKRHNLNLNCNMVNTSMITTILLFIRWTAILLWGNHYIVFIIELMIEYFFEVIDDITNVSQDYMCTT